MSQCKHIYSDSLHTLVGRRKESCERHFCVHVQEKTKEWLERKAPGGRQDHLTSEAASFFVAIRRRASKRQC